MGNKDLREETVRNGYDDRVCYFSSSSSSLSWTFGEVSCVPCGGHRVGNIVDLYLLFNLFSECQQRPLTPSSLYTSTSSVFTITKSAPHQPHLLISPLPQVKPLEYLNPDIELTLSFFPDTQPDPAHQIKLDLLAT